MSTSCFPIRDLAAHGCSLVHHSSSVPAGHVVFEDSPAVDVPAGHLLAGPADVWLMQLHRMLKLSSFDLHMDRLSLCDAWTIADLLMDRRGYQTVIHHLPDDPELARHVKASIADRRGTPTAGLDALAAVGSPSKVQKSVRLMVAQALLDGYPADYFDQEHAWVAREQGARLGASWEVYVPSPKGSLVGWRIPQAALAAEAAFMREQLRDAGLLERDAGEHRERPAMAA